MMLRVLYWNNNFTFIVYEGAQVGPITKPKAKTNMENDDAPAEIHTVPTLSGTVLWVHSVKVGYSEK